MDLSLFNGATTGPSQQNNNNGKSPFTFGLPTTGQKNPDPLSNFNFGKAETHTSMVATDQKQPHGGGNSASNSGQLQPMSTPTANRDPHGLENDGSLASTPYGITITSAELMTPCRGGGMIVGKSPAHVKRYEELIQANHKQGLKNLEEKVKRDSDRNAYYVKEHQAVANTTEAEEQALIDKKIAVNQDTSALLERRIVSNRQHGTEMDSLLNAAQDEDKNLWNNYEWECNNRLKEHLEFSALQTGDMYHNPTELLSSQPSNQGTPRGSPPATFPQLSNDRAVAASQSHEAAPLRTFQGGFSGAPFPQATPFLVPHILRCNLDDSGVFINDGFHIVDCGMAVVMEERLDIYDKDFPHNPVLSVYFTDVIDFSAGRFQSEHLNYERAQIKLVGKFDRDDDEPRGVERLTFRMPFDVVFINFHKLLESRLPPELLSSQLSNQGTPHGSPPATFPQLSNDGAVAASQSHEAAPLQAFQGGFSGAAFPQAPIGGKTPPASPPPASKKRARGESPRDGNLATRHRFA